MVFRSSLCKMVPGTRAGLAQGVRGCGGDWGGMGVRIGQSAPEGSSGPSPGARGFVPTGPGTPRLGLLIHVFYTVPRLAHTKGVP